jgi:hypothetical protein
MPDPSAIRQQQAAPARQPLLTLSWEGAVAGWMVVFGAALVELVAAIVTGRMPVVAEVPVVAFPVAVAAGFALVQWWQVTSSGAARANWWHYGGIAFALFVWLVYPTTPGVLAADTNARDACYSLSYPSPGCLSRVTHAMDAHNLVWWVTGGLIIGFALLARRSKIAAWAAIPVAFAGCVIATHFLDLLLAFYHAGAPGPV